MEEQKTITLRKITAKDIPALAGLYEQLIGQPADVNKMQGVFSLIGQNSHYSLLGAYDGGVNLIGTVMGLLCHDMVMDCRPILFMENLVVDRNHRGKGVGKALLAGIESIARQNNCLFIEFCSSMFRKEAHLFYESMGYEKDFVKGYRKFL